MGRGAYYAARAAGRAAVRERTRARQARERAQRNNPKLFENKNTTQQLGVGEAIFLFIIVAILTLLLF